jgi:hypothetical protein
MRRFSIKAITVGSLLGISTSFLLGFVFGIWLIIGVHQQHLPAVAEHKAEVRAIHHGKGVYLVIHFISATLGGYVAARIAKREAIFHGLGASVLSILLGVTLMLKGASIYPLWEQIIVIFFTILCSGFGGYLMLMQQHRSNIRRVSSYTH